jgi:hypothetical protein
MSKFDKLSNEDVQTAFEESFVEQIGSLNSISEVEAACIRNVGSDQFKIELTVYGLAGTPTLEDFRNGKVQKANGLVLKELNGRDDISFRFSANGGFNLNTTDYVVEYNSEE